MLWLGQFNLQLPPRTPDVLVHGICVLPDQMFTTPSKQSTVFAQFSHMHQVGKHIWSIHARPAGAGKYVEVNRIGDRNAPYDFNRQEFVPLGDNSFTIKPGDGFATHCQYDTSERSQVTTWGDETSDEMCLLFLMVTPGLKSNICVTPGISDGKGEFVLPGTKK